MKAPLFIAHRGASREEPENTLRAFRRALAVGADGIELDVRLTTDSVAFVHHDDLGRRSWSDLCRVRIGGESIPRLEEALDAIGGGAVTQIEIKVRQALPEVLRAVRRTRSADRVILASFDRRTVRDAAATAPKLLRMLIADCGQSRGKPEEAALDYLRAMSATGAHGLSLNSRAVDDERFVETMRRRAARLWCWTVNDRRAVRRLAAWGVDGIVTDDPAGMRRALG